MTDDPQGAGFPAEMLTDGARAVLAERHRQMAVEGWTAEHDDAHTKGELARAAAAYIHDTLAGLPYQGLPPMGWPFERSWWKPGTKRRNLVKAAALLVAELDRLDRLEALQLCGAVVPTLQFREVKPFNPMQRAFDVVLGDLFVGTIYSLRSSGWNWEFCYVQDQDGRPLPPDTRVTRSHSLAVAKRDFAEAVKAWLDKAQLQPIVASADARDGAEG